MAEFGTLDTSTSGGIDHTAAFSFGVDALGEEIVRPPSPPPLLRPSSRPTHSVRSEGGRSGSPDSANLRGTLRREEERVTLEEEELRRRAEEERARQPPPAEPEPAVDVRRPEPRREEETLRAWPT